jgi:transposase
LTPGNIADISVAKDLLDTVSPPKRLLADKAYDADSLRDWLKTRRVQAVIPSNATRRTPYPLDKVAYKRRNLIERMFCRLKDWRRARHGLSGHSALPVHTAPELQTAFYESLHLLPLDHGPRCGHWSALEGEESRYRPHGRRPSH